MNWDQSERHYSFDFPAALTDVVGGVKEIFENWQHTAEQWQPDGRSVVLAFEQRFAEQVKREPLSWAARMKEGLDAYQGAIGSWLVAEYRFTFVAQLAQLGAQWTRVSTATYEAIDERYEALPNHDHYWLASMQDRMGDLGRRLEQLLQPLA